VTGFTLHTDKGVIMKASLLLSSLVSFSLIVYGFASGHAWLTLGLIVLLAVLIFLISFRMWLQDEHEREGNDPFANPYNQPED